MLNLIKSNFVLKNIFSNIKTLIKLKILLYNKILLSKLNINITYYEEQYFLKEFNKKFDLNIENIKAEKMELKNKKLDNTIIDYLNKDVFKNLKYIYLSDNNINDIEGLSKVKFEALEVLNLSDNKISNINILEKVNFINLKVLNLSSNDIEDIRKSKF